LGHHPAVASWEVESCRTRLVAEGGIGVVAARSRPDQARTSYVQRLVLPGDGAEVVQPNEL
jgi:hypothetical protein